MNKELLFLLISLAVFAFSTVSLFTAPIINKNYSDFSRWGKINCGLFADRENNENNLDTIQKMKKYKNLCYRQKAMYNLEYTSLTIDIILGFICSQFGLFVYFKIGNNIEKISGIFGIITGIICLILTLVYVSFSGYIFTNDIAYRVIDPSQQNGLTTLTTAEIEKLFPNGAKLKIEFDITTTGSSPYSFTSKYTPYEGDNSEDSNLIKYKELGQKQYNYDKKYYEIHSDCTDINTPVYDTDNKKCQYIYPSTAPSSVKNKYLFDNWLTTLIFGCLISVSNILLIIFGCLLNKNKNKNEPDLLMKNENEPELLIKNDIKNDNDPNLILNNIINEPKKEIPKKESRIKNKKK